MEHITKSDWIKILKDNIFWLYKDVSDPHYDIRDYQELDEKDYDEMADDIMSDIQEILSKKRSAKINKIKNNIGG